MQEFCRGVVNKMHGALSSRRSPVTYNAPSRGEWGALVSPVTGLLEVPDLQYLWQSEMNEHLYLRSDTMSGNTE